MSTHILVINCGSSSLKFALLDPKSGGRLMNGLAESLGTESARLRIEGDGAPESPPLEDPSHQGALQGVLAALKTRGWTSKIRAVGHRVVHGGELFVRPTLLNEEVLKRLSSLSHLAPLHNPVNLQGVRAAQKAFPELPQIAVFDTAFHQSMPAFASRYAVPEPWYKEHGVRRYGFHGTSHHYVAEQAAKFLQRPLKDLSLLTAHLGNGCSATAIAGGKSVDTTMGMTPLSGLVMGTRSGDVDPGLLAYMAERLEGGIESVNLALNNESGLLGLSQCSHDMRTLLDAEKSGNTKAKLAIEVFCYRLAASLSSLSVALPRLDALIFTGGIGEHSAQIRARVLQRLWSWKLEVHKDKNLDHGQNSGGLIAKSEDDTTQVLVIPTDEETMIARQTLECLE